jgi:N utilization substance protein B
MLSRHFLRAKALQAVYASVTSQIEKVDDVAAAYDFNVGRLNDLGILQLSTLTQLAFTAERINEAQQQKRLAPSSENTDVRHLGDNSFISRLNDSFQFQQRCNRMNIDWSSHFDTFRKIFNQLKTVQSYKDYVAAPSCSFDDDKAVALVAFKCLMNDDTLREIIFGRDLLWEDDFDQIAQYNYMMLKDFTDETLNEAIACPLVYNSDNSKDANDYDFARQLAVDTFIHIDDNEPLIKKHLQNWDMDRVALMDIILINMAITEFTCCPSIPERVTVDEYIELSKEFSTEKSKLFINGILDKILIELRVAGRIQKNSRGLYDPEIDGDTPPDDEA